jgi:membrane protein YdbS with pleckstrin-like domain
VQGNGESISAAGWRRPSPRLLQVRRLEVGVVAALAAAGAGIVASRSSGWAGAIAAAVALAAGAVAEIFVRRRVRAWAYAERDDDLLVRRGVLFSRLSVVPYGRMQFIDVTAGPIERSFGLATVRLHTAAAASDARIPGLSRDEAARLRDRLTELGEAQAAGL